MRGTAAMVAMVLLGACGSDEPERVIGLNEVVHEWRTPGATTRQVAVSSLDGTPTRQLTTLTSSAFHPAVSPDGRLVVFRYLGRLWLYDVPGDALRQFTFGPPLDDAASWTPDGQAIVYASQRYAIPETSDICIRPLAGGEPECLTTSDEFDDSSPDMSPDGSQIVWQRRGPDFLSDIWIMNADGSNQRLLVDHSDIDTDPQWSPDGRFILFRSRFPPFSPPTQFILELATGQIRPVLGDSLHPVLMNWATWGPDGQSVIVGVVNPNNRFAQVDLMTGDVWFVNQDTLSTSYYPRMRR